MLVSLFAIIFVLTSGHLWASSGEDHSEGGAALIDVHNLTILPEKQEEIPEQKKIELEDFKKLPKAVEDQDPKPPLPWTHSAIVIDADSGKVLYGKDEQRRMPLASLNKMMTALVLIDHIKDWDQDVLVSKEAAFAGGAAVHLKWDERVDAGDLLKAMLMNSDNSAAIALAEHAAGSKAAFADLMNKKAKEIGLLDSNFTDPSGLEDEQSYSTAYDMARLTQHALKSDKIVKTMQITGPIQIASCDGAITHRVGNTNNFLKDERLANRVICGKTGFTYNAGYNLMMALEDKDGKRRAIGVVLNSDDKMRWEEMKEMLEWSFNNYRW